MTSLKRPPEDRHKSAGDMEPLEYLLQQGYTCEAAQAILNMVLLTHFMLQDDERMRGAP